jgi:myo-inositol 2-dehydrogenase/D-chiro-inositol 1-dehydrogenase
MTAAKPLLGVGIVGAGPVTQAIHLPTLAGLSDEFRVVHIVDLDEATARVVARGVDARWSVSVEKLLADPGVDVVAVCSPHRLHVGHVIAALRAGKAVLCEKPLAMDLPGLTELGRASGIATSPVMVGWMHLYDPVAASAIGSWNDDDHRADVIRVSVVLPSNGRFERAATEIYAPEVPTVVATRPAEPALREALLTLAVHDLPLVRRLLRGDPAPIEIIHASWGAPWGYLVLMRIGDVRVELHASMGQPWKPSWTLEAISERASLRIDFPPSYVHAGSATARTSRAGGRVETLAARAEDGYDREWRRIAQAIRDGSAGALDDALLDAEFAIAVADAAGRWAEEALTA